MAVAELAGRHYQVNCSVTFEEDNLCITGIEVWLVNCRQDFLLTFDADTAGIEFE